MEKIYIIEYRGESEYSNQYCTNYQKAKEHLEKQGYTIRQELNEENNDAALFVFPETEFFAEARARIVVRNSLIV